MRRYLFSLFLCLLFYGCAWNYEFGRSSDPSAGTKYIGTFERAKPGMTKKEVEQQFGVPRTRNYDVQYMGKGYDEMWVYDTQPPTVLYFKGSVLVYKEYQQGQRGY